MLYSRSLFLPILYMVGYKCGEGNGTPLQHSCLENPMDGEAWWAAVHGVAKSRTQLSDFPFTFHFPALEKEMATHSSVLAWRIPGTGEPGGLPSMGSHRVRHDWIDLAAAAAAAAGYKCNLGVNYILKWPVAFLVSVHREEKFERWGRAPLYGPFSFSWVFTKGFIQSLP